VDNQFYRGDIMKKYIIGFIVGMIIGGGSAWAFGAMGIWIQDNNGNLMGTASNPLYITSN
jgi:type III secretory pathway component EscT